LQYATASRVRTRETSRSKWAARYNGDTTLLVVRPRSIFGRTLIQLGRKLIVHDLAFGSKLPRFPQVRNVEVIDTPGENLALLLELLGSGNGGFQRAVGTPMQKAAINGAGMESGERDLAIFYCSASRVTLRQDLCDQKDPVTPSGDRFAHQIRRDSETIHFHGISLIRAEIDTCKQCIDSCIAIFRFDVASSPANHQDLTSGCTEPMVLHFRSLLHRVHQHQQRRRLLCRRQCFPCLAEQLIHLCIERRDVIRLAAGDQVAIDHDFFIDPVCPRIAQISLE
jgi:hypothetical protein